MWRCREPRTPSSEPRTQSLIGRANSPFIFSENAAQNCCNRLIIIMIIALGSLFPFFRHLIDKNDLSRVGFAWISVNPERRTANLILDRTGEQSIHFFRKCGPKLL